MAYVDIWFWERSHHGGLSYLFVDHMSKPTAKPSHLGIHVGTTALTMTKYSHTSHLAPTGQMQLY